VSQHFWTKTTAFGISGTSVGNACFLPILCILMYLHALDVDIWHSRLVISVRNIVMLV
jgi:hypothetical protein